MLKALRAFMALHRHGTIAAAAEEVHLSAAAVSVQLKQLEDRLGTALFERTGRSVALSSAGLRLLPLAERMLAIQDELLAFGSGTSLRGHVSLGVISSVLLDTFPRMLRGLRADHPGLLVKVVAGTSANLVAQVEAGLLDAAVVSQPPSRLREPLCSRPLFTDRVALVQPTPPAHATVGDAVAGSEYIAFDRTTWVGRLVERLLLRAGIHAEPSLELDSHEAVLAAVRCGLGVSVLPVIRGDPALADPRLSFTPLGGARRVVCLVERKTHAQAHVTRELADAMEATAKAGKQP